MPAIDVPGREHPVDVPDDEFRKGPPEVDVDGRSAFDQRSPAQQVDAWRKWLSSGRDLIALDAARRSARRATEMIRRAPRVDGVELRELPERLEVMSVDRVVYGSLGSVGPEAADRTTVILSDVELDVVGPPDQQGAYDPDYRKIADPEARKERWRRYLFQYPKPPEHYVDAQVWFLDLMRQRVDDPDAYRYMDALGLHFETDPKKTWAKVLGSLSFLGLGVVIGGALGGTLGKMGGRPTPVGAPTGLTVTSTPTPSGAATGHDVSVNWVLPATGPTPDRWDVTLTPIQAATGPMTSVTGSMTSAVLAGVDAGKYMLTVVGSLQSDHGEVAALLVTVPASTTTSPPATTPNPPTAVTVTAGVSGTSNLRGLTVAWTPSATGSSPTGYTILLQTTGRPPIDVGPVATGPVTSYRFEPSPPGTYQAIVVATNEDLSSGAVTSPAATLDAAPSAVPDAPRNVTTHVYASGTAGKAALTISWDPPGSGAEVTGYDVAITRTRTVRRVGLARSTTFDPIDDGSRGIALVAYNEAGRGKGVTPAPTVVIDHTKLDSDGVSWAPVLARDEVDEFEKFKAPFTAMDEKTFWDNVTRALEDTAGVHGGLASYPAMLFLARLLALWIEAPAMPPTEPQIAAMADQIAATASFPTVPPDTTKVPPDTEHADRIGPWKAARTLVAPVTRKSLPVRYKIFGLVRALERYLGEHN